MFTGIIESLGLVRKIVPSGDNIHMTILCDFTDELKIDQSFMVNSTTDEDSKAIIIHAREIAQQLGLTTTAEGIESQEVLALAQEYKLDYGQGYYFSPAITAKNLEGYIQKHGLNAAMFIQDTKKVDQRLE